MVLDMAKEKKMPGTNKKPKYKGPFQVTNMTDSHLIAKKDEKMMKYPIHLTRKYYPRLDEVLYINMRSSNFYIIILIKL